MTERARQLLEEAMQLPEEQRVELAQLLIASVGEASGPEGSWAVEIERRARRALRGEETAEDWEVVRARLPAKHTR